MRRLIFWLILAHSTFGMFIPEEVEIMDGFAPMSHIEINPEDDYFEARALSEGSLFNSIRNRRNTKYEVLESNGLQSHFRPNSVNAFRTILSRSSNDEVFGPSERHKRNAESKSNENTSNVDVNKSKAKENNENVLKIKSNPLASPLVSKWTRTPFEYSKMQHDEDSLAMDSTQTNEGIKSRTPRVNFVTQQKKSLDQNDSKSSATKSEFYKSPPLIHGENRDSMSSSTSQPMHGDHYADRHATRSSAVYPEYYREREPERYMNRYDG